MGAAELFYAKNCGSQPCSETFSGAMSAGGGQDHIAPEHSLQREIYNVSIVHLMAGASMNPLVLKIRRVGIEVIINPLSCLKHRRATFSSSVLPYASDPRDNIHISRYPTSIVI